MTEPTSKVLCGSCKAPVELVADADPEMVRCPICGASDTTENAFREVGQHAAEVMQRRFNETLADSTRGSKFVKFTSKPILHRSYKFVADLKL